MLEHYFCLCKSKFAFKIWMWIWTLFREENKCIISYSVSFWRMNRYSSSRPRAAAICHYLGVDQWMIIFFYHWHIIFLHWTSRPPGDERERRLLWVWFREHYYLQVFLEITYYLLVLGGKKALCEWIWVQPLTMSVYFFLKNLSEIIITILLLGLKILVRKILKIYSTPTLLYICMLIYKHFKLWTKHTPCYIYIHTRGSSKCCPRSTACCFPPHLRFLPTSSEVEVNTLQ